MKEEIRGERPIKDQPVSDIERDDVTQQATVHSPLGKSSGVQEPPHQAYCQHRTPRLRCLQHLITLCDGKRHRLFYQHVDPGRDQLDTHRGVEIIGKRHDCHINAEVKQITIRCQYVWNPKIHGQLLCPGLVGIHQGHDVTVVTSCQGWEVPVRCHRTAPNEGDLEIPARGCLLNAFGMHEDVLWFSTHNYLSPSSYIQY